MKHLIIYTTAIILFLQMHADEKTHSHLIDRLSEAYTTNNILIHEKAPKSTKGHIDALTDNYIDQLQYIKLLSDDHLTRKLRDKESQYITESLILKNYIIDLYDRETSLLQNCCKTASSKNSTSDDFIDTDWDEAIPFIYRSLSILHRLHIAPELVENISGLVDRNTLNRYYYNALNDSRDLIPKDHTITIKKTFPCKSNSPQFRAFYVIGEMQTNIGENSLYLSKLFLSKKQHGLFIADIQEINDPRGQKRALKHLQ